MLPPAPTRTPLQRTFALSCAAALLLASATGCSEVQAGELDQDGSQAGQTTETQSAGGKVSAREEKARAESLVTAGRTALSVVPDTHVTGLHFKDDEWLVHLATSEGSRHDVRLTDSGATLVGLPMPAETRKSERAQTRLRLNLAQVDHRQALKSFQENGPGGQVQSLELRSVQDRVVWAVRVQDGALFLVDALTGHLADG